MDGNLAMANNIVDMSERDMAELGDKVLEVISFDDHMVLSNQTYQHYPVKLIPFDQAYYDILMNKMYTPKHSKLCIALVNINDR